MLRRVLASSRFIVLIAVLGTFVASLTLLVYEGLVVAEAVVRIVAKGQVSAQGAKALAIGLIEAVDIFSSRSRSTSSAWASTRFLSTMRCRSPAG